MSDELQDKIEKLKVRAPKRVPTLLPDIYGKLPPQTRELEEAVLGALMLEKNAFTSVYQALHKDVFYTPAHSEIFIAIKHLFDGGDAVDLLTVTNELRKTGKLEEVGGAYYISTLTSKVTGAAHIEYYSRIIVQKYIMRELIAISSKIQRDAYEESADVFTLLDEAEKSLYEITSKNLKRDFADLGGLLRKSLDKLEELKNKEDGLSDESVPSGFIELDRITSGWQKSDLIICAARPGMGKTAFVLSLARNAAVNHKKAVAIFSLEMSAIQLVNRLISSETGINSDKLRNANLEPYEWIQLQQKITSLSEAKIFIDDSPQINIFELRAKCRRLKQMHGVSIFIIDYLQLMSANSNENKGMNREQEISTISRNLKSLAKELDTPVIALAQLSRATEQRGGLKRPMLSDLRESGSIEQDADMVMFLYRPEYYQITEDSEGNSLVGVAEIILAKHRNGATGSVYCKFVSHLSKFEDFSPSDLQTFTLVDGENKKGSYSKGGARKNNTTNTVQSKGFGAQSSSQSDVPPWEI